MRVSFLIALGLSLFASNGCITNRTVTQGGRTVEEKIVIKRPITNTLKKIEFE